MKDRMEHWFGLIASFIGRICIAGFLAGLSSTPLVEGKSLNSFMIAITILICLLLWEQKHRMKILGGLASAWAIVKIVQWNTSAQWHYDTAFFVFFVVVLYFERKSGASDLVRPEEKTAPRPTSPSA